jgi:hypothetical protein
MERYFEITSPRDLLAKAKRDYERMKADLSTDTILNFFVTTYHIVDYVKALGTVTNPQIEQLYADPDFKMCQFLCNKGKHIKLRDGDIYEAKHDPAIPGGILSTFVFDYDKLGGPERFIVVDGIKEVDVVELGARLIQKWETFFGDHRAILL